MRSLTSPDTELDTTDVSAGSLLTPLHAVKSIISMSDGRNKPKKYEHLKKLEKNRGRRHAEGQRTCSRVKTVTREGAPMT